MQLLLFFFLISLFPFFCAYCASAASVLMANKSCPIRTVFRFFVDRLVCKSADVAWRICSFRRTRTAWARDVATQKSNRLYTTPLSINPR